MDSNPTYRWSVNIVTDDLQASPAGHLNGAGGPAGARTTRKPAEVSWAIPGRNRRGRAPIPMTTPEVRRLLTRLVWTESQTPDFILHWSSWRRRHQARAQQCHFKRPLPNLRL